MDISEQIINILIDFRRGKISSSEKQLLDKWIKESEIIKKFSNHLLIRILHPDN